MSRYDSPLDDGDDRNTDQVVHYDGVDVKLQMSPDGKRVWVTLESEVHERRSYELGGARLGGADLSFADQTMQLSDAHVKFEWFNGGLGAYPGIVIVSC